MTPRSRTSGELVPAPLCEDVEDFDARALFYLARSHWLGRTVRLAEALSCTSEEADAALDRLRGLGVTIQGDHDGGRVLVGLTAERARAKARDHGLGPSAPLRSTPTS